MGIYDRDYYRDESRGGAWFSGVAPATKTFLVINVAVFLAQWLTRSEEWARFFAARSDLIFERGWVWQLITAAFFQVEPISLIFSMLILWWVGREIETMYGSPEFSRFYLTACAVSTLVWALLDYFGRAPGGAFFGATGAVTALFVLYATYYPRREILLFFVIPMPIWLVVVIFLGLDLLMLLDSARGGGGTAGFAAHLGGAAYGFLYRRLDLRWSKLLQSRRFKPNLRVVRPEPRDRDITIPFPPGGSTRATADVPASPRASIGHLIAPEQLDERLDEVLAKIAREGRAGLTEEERMVLEEASRRARDRRTPRV